MKSGFDAARARSKGQRDGNGDRTGTAPGDMARALLDNLRYRQAKLPKHATLNDWYMALAYTVRDRMLDNYITTVDAITGSSPAKVVAYLSAEFLTGPHLGNSLVNLGLWDTAKEAVTSVGQDLAVLLEHEEEPGLGNGGLGRLAACYMDSLATLNVPAIGYGIRYEFGIFDQAIRDGWQVELTDKWLRFGNPWEIVRSETSYDVQFGGRTDWYQDDRGEHRVRWVPDRVVKGVAYDTPVPGYRIPSTNLLRLWKAEATESFDFDAFNVGDYYGAVDEKVASETISKVLYPNDEPEAGKRLRLQQQVLLRLLLAAGHDPPPSRPRRPARRSRRVVGGSAQRHPPRRRHRRADAAARRHTRHGMGSGVAASRSGRAPTRTTRCWRKRSRSGPVRSSARCCHAISRSSSRSTGGCSTTSGCGIPATTDWSSRLSIIDETGDQYVRMANLASAGSHAINGVAALHTELLKQTVLRDFHTIAPEKFFNVTNGVTPRRWLALSNPRLSALITGHIGDRWTADLENELARLEPLATDRGFQRDWQDVKAANKAALAALLEERTGIVVDPQSLFDVQVKRLHEYKRQHLNVLYLVTLYNRLSRDSGTSGAPRTVIFGGKAAPGYRMAKLIIRLITGVAEVVNGDPKVSARLKVVFLPDFNVKTSHHVYPAADLSEQLSMAGKEASGTGNMKFAMNGALTIGTLDGANVEIRDAVGPEHFFLFGMTAPEVAARKARGYRARDVYEANAELRETLDLIGSGLFSKGDREMFQPLLHSLLERDEYMLLADYQDYVDAQQRVSDAWGSRREWTRMSILNCARVGRFSSDRSIRDYCRDIWNISPPELGGHSGERS